MQQEELAEAGRLGIERQTMAHLATLANVARRQREIQVEQARGWSEVAKEAVRGVPLGGAPEAVRREEVPGRPRVVTQAAPFASSLGLGPALGGSRVQFAGMASTQTRGFASQAPPRTGTSELPSDRATHATTPILPGFENHFAPPGAPLPPPRELTQVQSQKPPLHSKPAIPVDVPVVPSLPPQLDSVKELGIFDYGAVRRRVEGLVRRGEGVVGSVETIREGDGYQGVEDATEEKFSRSTYRPNFPPPSPLPATSSLPFILASPRVREVVERAIASGDEKRRVYSRSPSPSREHDGRHAWETVPENSRREDRVQAEAKARTDKTISVLSPTPPQPMHQGDGTLPVSPVAPVFDGDVQPKSPTRSTQPVSILKHIPPRSPRRIPHRPPQDPYSNAYHAAPPPPLHVSVDPPSKAPRKNSSATSPVRGSVSPTRALGSSPPRLRPPAPYTVRLAGGPVYLRRTTVRPPTLRFVSEPLEAPREVATRSVAVEVQGRGVQASLSPVRIRSVQDDLNAQTEHVGTRVPADFVDGYRGLVRTVVDRATSPLVPQPIANATMISTGAQISPVTTAPIPVAVSQASVQVSESVKAATVERADVGVGIGGREVAIQVDAGPLSITPPPLATPPRQVSIGIPFTPRPPPIALEFPLPSAAPATPSTRDLVRGKIAEWVLSGRLQRHPLRTDPPQRVDASAFARTAELGTELSTSIARVGVDTKDVGVGVGTADVGIGVGTTDVGIGVGTADVGVSVGAVDVGVDTTWMPVDNGVLAGSSHHNRVLSQPLSRPVHERDTQTSLQEATPTRTLSPAPKQRPTLSPASLGRIFSDIRDITLESYLRKETGLLAQDIVSDFHKVIDAVVSSTSEELFSEVLLEVIREARADVDREDEQLFEEAINNASLTVLEEYIRMETSKIASETPQVASMAVQANPPLEIPVVSPGPTTVPRALPRSIPSPLPLADTSASSISRPTFSTDTHLSTSLSEGEVLTDFFSEGELISMRAELEEMVRAIRARAAASAKMGDTPPNASGADTSTSLSGEKSGETGSASAGGTEIIALAADGGVSILEVSSSLSMGEAPPSHEWEGPVSHGPRRVRESKGKGKEPESRRAQPRLGGGAGRTTQDDVQPTGALSRSAVENELPSFSLESSTPSGSLGEIDLSRTHSAGEVGVVELLREVTVHARVTEFRRHDPASSPGEIQSQSKSEIIRRSELGNRKRSSRPFPGVPGESSSQKDVQRSYSHDREAVSPVHTPARFSSRLSKSESGGKGTPRRSNSPQPVVIPARPLSTGSSRDASRAHSRSASLTSLGALDFLYRVGGTPRPKSSADPEWRSVPGVSGGGVRDSDGGYSQLSQEPSRSVASNPERPRTATMVPERVGEQDSSLSDVASSNRYAEGDSGATEEELEFQGQPQHLSIQTFERELAQVVAQEIDALSMSRSVSATETIRKHGPSDSPSLGGRITLDVSKAPVSGGGQEQRAALSNQPMGYLLPQRHKSEEEYLRSETVSFETESLGDILNIEAPSNDNELQDLLETLEI
ncbi:hypothetical protein HDU93_009991 [Gonapodya sp. JEL0774]|nr:hypothetical protein HDU93_009991 [Gonapodya sp. JEL0774]